MSFDAASQWYVVHTHSHGEAKAAEHLRRQGFGVYLPCYLKRRRHARRVEIIPAPLFPRYLFVGIDIDNQRWRSIRSTIGVAHLICRGEAPVPVVGQVVEALRQREDCEGFIKLDQRPHFSSGDKVRILDGAFGGSLGLFEGMTDNERITVLLDLLGRKVRVRLDLDSVDAA